MAYATVGQLTDVLGYAPANASVLLDRASRDIDRALLTAVYDNTDATIVAALQAATIEQVAWRLEMGNDRGISHDNLATASGPAAGAITVGRSGAPRPAYGEPTTSKPALAEQAYLALQAAGLTAWGPIPT